MSFPPPDLAAFEAAEEVEESMVGGAELVEPVQELVSPALPEEEEEVESSLDAFQPK